MKKIVIALVALMSVTGVSAQNKIALNQEVVNESIIVVENSEVDPYKIPDLKPGKNRVYFKSLTMGGEIKMAGDLYVPANFDRTKKYPTVVFTGPFNQVKEQTGAVYAKKFAEKGYLFFAFDHQGFGDSEGEIRNYEHNGNKMEGLEDAISFLRMHSFVDREKFYGLGVCFGANTMVYTALTDKRLKKISVVSGMLSHTLVTFKAEPKEKVEQNLVSANEARQRYYETGIIEKFDPLHMDVAQESDIVDVREGYDYYMTERAGTQTCPNYCNLGPEFIMMDNGRWNALSVGKLLTTPVLTVYGTKASTKILSQLFHIKTKKPSKKLAIKGATHVDLYDRDEYVDQAVNGIIVFFEN
jgi:fermentation-respiration switch protein FrsA (DUF1100 family)